jgi:hypothetical protein
MTERGRVVADKKSEKKGSVWYIFNLIERSRVGTIAANAGIACKTNRVEMNSTFMVCLFRKK